MKNSANSVALVGRYDRKLGRDKLLTLPVEWLRALGDARHVFVLPDSNERCLNIIPPPVMEKELDRLRWEVLKDPEMLPALQTIGSMIEQLDLDRRHRIRISDKLRDWAGIKKNAVLVGCVRVIKVWRPEVLGPNESFDEKTIVKELTK